MDRNKKYMPPKVPSPGPGGRRGRSRFAIIEHLLPMLAGAAVTVNSEKILKSLAGIKDWGTGVIERGREIGSRIPETYLKSDLPNNPGMSNRFYDMTNRGIEGEVINTPPMTGDRTMPTYDMRTDNPGFGYVNVDGEVYAQGTQPRGKPGVLNVAPKETTSQGSLNYESKPLDMEVDVFENPEIKEESMSSLKRIFGELSKHDLNTIEDMETKGVGHYLYGKDKSYLDY